MSSTKQNRVFKTRFSSRNAIDLEFARLDFYKNCQMGVVIKDRRTAKCLWVNIEGEELCFTTDLSARQWESWVRCWVRGYRWEEMRVFCTDEMCLSSVEWGFRVCMFGCEGEWECSGRLSKSEKWNKSWVCVLCLKYDHKSSIRNLISTWLHV